MKSLARMRAVGVATLVALLVVGGSTAAKFAPSESDAQTASDAETVFVSVYTAQDPAAVLAALSAEERQLFDQWTTIDRVISSADDFAAPPPEEGVVACSSFTQRGSFVNQLGAKLGDFWTTGQGCRDGAAVTSVAYLDGGGTTSALGWSYVGRTSNKGIINGVGKVYGAYTFKLVIGGVEVQRPTYCARTIHTSATTYGDGVCGI